MRCNCISLVRPQVEYASSVWSFHTKQNIIKIEMTQRRVARWVKKKKKKKNYSPYESVSNMLDDLGWRSLENRRIDCRLVMLHKIYYSNPALHSLHAPSRFQTNPCICQFLPTVVLPSYNCSLECSASRHCPKN